MYIVKEYLTGNTVAIVSRKQDALSMIRNTQPNEPRLVVEKSQ
jgi:hypothetical protein